MPELQNLSTNPFTQERLVKVTDRGRMIGVASIVPPKTPRNSSNKFQVTVWPGASVTRHDFPPVDVPNPVYEPTKRKVTDRTKKQLLTDLAKSYIERLPEPKKLETSNSFENLSDAEGFIKSHTLSEWNRVRQILIPDTDIRAKRKLRGVTQRGLDIGSL